MCSITPRDTVLPTFQTVTIVLGNSIFCISGDAMSLEISLFLDSVTFLRETRKSTLKLSKRHLDTIKILIKEFKARQ